MQRTGPPTPGTRQALGTEITKLALLALAFEALCLAFLLVAHLGSSPIIPSDQVVPLSGVS